jgi:predicted 2-oxoglutarate/Fe(II)-dependent dioxygenase YbiX
LFDGEQKGIPILSIVGLLNNDFSGGNFIFFDDYEIKLTVGDIMIFPSLFLYPHRVEEITNGTRHAFVSWAY